MSPSILPDALRLTRPVEAHIAAIRGSLKVAGVPIAVEGRETFETGVAHDNA